MKRFLTLVLMVLAVVYALFGCGCDSGENAGLVFINELDATIVEVSAGFADQVSGMRRADSSPLKQGESFGFEVGGYPVMLVVYGDLGRTELARTTIRTAPPEGERWYVTARDGGNGLVFSVDTNWGEALTGLETTAVGPPG